MEAIVGIIFIIFVVLSLSIYLRERIKIKSKGHHCKGCNGCPFYTECGMGINTDAETKKAEGVSIEEEISLVQEENKGEV